MTLQKQNPGGNNVQWQKEKKTYYTTKKLIQTVCTLGSKLSWSITFTTIWLGKSHWDFSPKCLSLHYYTTLEGVLGVQRSGQAQGTIISFFGPLVFSQNGMTLKKTYKNYQSLVKSYCFLGYLIYPLHRLKPNT